jgi:hypothetical protein
MDAGMICARYNKAAAITTSITPKPSMAKRYTNKITIITKML